MRKAAPLVPLALALLVGGCTLPFGLQFAGFPWQWKKPAPRYCMVSLELPNEAGIGAAPAAPPEAVDMACAAPPAGRRQ